MTTVASLCALAAAAAVTAVLTATVARADQPAKSGSFEAAAAIIADARRILTPQGV